MKTAGAIVTDRGGRTCHAAIVARELGVPAVVGCEYATATLQDRPARHGVLRRRATSGQVYDGDVPFEVTSVPTSDTGVPRTAHHGQPRQSGPGVPHRDAAERRRRPGAHGVHHQRAYRHPSDGAGPPGKVTTRGARRASRRWRSNVSSPREFFVRELAEGVGTIAAAF